MADVLTQTLRLTQPTVGGDGGLWGGLVNSDLTYIDQGINQAIIVPVADINTVLVADGTAGDQARYQSYVIQGAWTATRTITLPPNLKFGRVVNGTSGGFDVIFTTGSGTVLQVPHGGDLFFRCDGTNVFPMAGISNLGVIGVSASTGAAFSLPTSFRSFRIIAQNIQANTLGGSLRLQFSSNGGTSFIGSGYNYVGPSCVFGSATVSATSATGAASILLTPGLANAVSGDPYSLRLEIDPGSASVAPRVLGSGYGLDSGGVYQSYSFGGGGVTSGAPVNFCQVLSGLGTFNALFTVLGIF